MSGAVTGAAVIGIKYGDGVLIAADTKISFGRTAYSNEFQRLEKLSDNAILCATGDIADSQYLSRKLKAMVHQELVENNNIAGLTQLNARRIHNYACRLLYQRRCKMNPILNSAVVAGYDGEGFVGYVDHLGTAYEDRFVVTGFGKYFSIGPLREEYREDFTFEEARSMALRCLKVLFLRDCTAGSRVQIARVDSSGVHLEEPIVIDAKGSFDLFATPTTAFPLEGCQY